MQSLLAAFRRLEISARAWALRPKGGFFDIKYDVALAREMV